MIQRSLKSLATSSNSGETLTTCQATPGAARLVHRTLGSIWMDRSTLLQADSIACQGALAHLDGEK